MPEPAELARRLEVTERRLSDARTDARTLAATNEKLNSTLVTARNALDALRAEVEALGKPPSTFGHVVGTGEGTLDVATNGRWLRCALSPELAEHRFALGNRVLLNEALLVVGITDDPGVGETARLVSTLPPLVEPVETPQTVAEPDEAPEPLRLLITTATGEETVVLASASLNAEDLRPGTPLLVDRRAALAMAVLPNNEVADLTLEDVPDVSYADIGGLSDQIEQIRDAVGLPFRHRELFAEFGLRPPKGVLLYGPPGCGKTMIAKAVANSAGSHFLNIKGPELLNKYVGETERQIRAIFTRAKEHATSGRPVIVFFDEMDALFRTRGSGVSSDVEATVVPQLLAEIDGVEDLANVIVIGATNREDLIDPAILRPGRLDVKIKLERPDRAAAAEILARYLTEETPLNPTLRQAQGSLAEAQGSLAEDRGTLAEAQGSLAEAQGTLAEDRRTLADDRGTLAEPVEARTRFRQQLIDAIVDRLYARTDANRFIEVTYAGGDKETLYVGDFVSGAMLAGVVDRAKKAAIKELINGGERGVRLAHVEAACAAEIGENEELPNTTNPDDWARVSGRKGERIVFLRTLVGARALNP